MKKYYLLLAFTSIFWTILSLTGIDNAIINWTFLLLLFGTTIGANFFDKSLVKNRFLEDIGEENLILRKISFYIGVSFLYIGIYIPDKVLNSRFYFLFTDEVLNSTSYLSLPFDITISQKYLLDILVKACFSTLVFGTYWGAQNQILYWFFKSCYRNKELKNSSKLAKVVIDNGVWKVKEKNVLPQHLTNLKRIGIDTYQIKGNRDTYYVSQKSEILEKIEGTPETAGYSILGVIDNVTKGFALLTIGILLISPILDNSVKVTNGIYNVYGNSDKIEIIDDTIIYNGKAEKFDTRKQSFSMGKIKKNDNNNITITFYKNGEETHFTKVNSSGIPYELKEKYSGSIQEPSTAKLKYSIGTGTLFFNKNENKITKTGGQIKPFVVISKDKLDGKAKDDFNQHKSEFKGNYFIFTTNKKYDKVSSNVYVAVLSDRGKTIQINKLDSSAKDDNYFYHFTGNSE